MVGVGIGLRTAVVCRLFARSPLDASATEGKTEADPVGTPRGMLSIQPPLMAAAVEDRWMVFLVGSLRLFARPLLVASTAGSKSEASIGATVCWLFARSPPDAAATRDKAEARTMMSVLRLFPHSPLDAKATRGKVEAVFFAAPLPEVIST